MAARSRTAANTFSRARLAVGLLGVTVIAGGIVFAIAKMGDGPDPGRLIYSAKQGVFEHDLSTGKKRRLLRLPRDTLVATTNHDATWVGYQLKDGAVWLASLEGERRFRVSDRFTVPLGWSPDGRLIVSELLSDRDLVAVDPDGGREILLSGGYAAGAVPMWIDDDSFAIQASKDEFVVVDAGAPAVADRGVLLTASADGAQLMYAFEDAVHVADVDGARLSNKTVTFRGDASFAASSPEGFVAIAGSDGVHVLEGGTRTERVVDGEVEWLGWTRRGTVLLYASKGVAYALELPDGKPKQLTPKNVDTLDALAYQVAQ